MMGEIAKTLVALSGSQSVHGVIPDPLTRFEQKNRPDPSEGHNGISTKEGEAKSDYEKVYGQLTIVSDMHTRKHLMAKKVMEGGPGSAFIGLSGGFGTLEELMEMVTWNQLSIHDKPVIAFNVDGYYTPLFEWINGAVGRGFISKDNKGILAEAKTVEECFQAIKDYKLSKGRVPLTWNQI